MRILLIFLLLIITTPSYAQESAELYARCFGAYTGIVSTLEKYSIGSKAQKEQINQFISKRTLMLEKLNAFNLSDNETDRLFEKVGAEIGNNAVEYAKLCDKAMGFNSTF